MGGGAHRAARRNAAAAARVLLAVLCLHALSASVRALAVPEQAEGAECACGGRGGRRALIRGDAQLTLCRRGYYCDCVTGSRGHCFNVLGLGFKFDEDRQQCNLGFDCDKFFRNEEPTAAPTNAPPITSAAPSSTPGALTPTTPTPASTPASNLSSTPAPPPATPTPTTPTSTTPTPTTPTPTTPTPTTPSPTTPTPVVECVCDASAPHNFSLIRGKDQVKQCKQGYYCDCGSGQKDQCINVWGLGYKFDEDRQQCELRFDCVAFFGPQPPAPQPQPPGPDAACACEPGSGSSRARMVLRGADEVDLCDHGWYCDCGAGTRGHCTNLWGWGWRLDEDLAECRWDFDCEAFFARANNGTTTTAPPTTTTTPSPPRTPTAATPPTQPSTRTPSTTSPPGTQSPETPQPSPPPTETSSTAASPQTQSPETPPITKSPTRSPTETTPTRKPSKNVGAAERATLALVLVSATLTLMALL